jgi:hypothetical protein
MNKILLVCLFVATLGFAEETNLTITVDGVTYRDVRFEPLTPASVTMFHATGVATIPLEKLSPELQKKFGYDPQQAAQWQAAQQKAIAEAAEEQRKTAATVEWKLTVQNILVDGVVARGCRTMVYCPHPVSIFLVEHPQLSELAEGNQIIVTAYKNGIAKVGKRTLEKWVYHPMSQQASNQPSAPSPTDVKQPIQRKPQAVQAVADVYVPELRTTGAFGFPQGDARILCNKPALRFSVWNNDKYLFAQAVLWTDDDSSLGKYANGNEFGDYSRLMLDLDDNGKDTPDLDRIYTLNGRHYPGLSYRISKSPGVGTGTKSDSEGRGAIRYVQTSDKKRVRVDTYLIPLQEISRRAGDRIGICYYGSSPKPRLSINSVTFDSRMPQNKYREYVLTTMGGAIDIMKVPEGRNDKTESQH